MTPYFKPAEIQELFQVIAVNHLADNVAAAALAGIDPLFRATLPGAGSAANFIITLQTLNNTGRLVDGTIPMETFLFYLRVTTRVAEVTQVAGRLLAVLEGKASPSTANDGPKYAAGQQEAYTGNSDEMVPFDFLEQGHTAGRAVAKLVVPRFHAGQPAVNGLGKPRRYNGTGWLVAKDLLITNFHVVMAREGEEADPSAEDLALQVAGTEVQLDFDREGAVPRVTSVLEAVALGARGPNDVDYAVLRLQPLAAAWPRPLRLRKQPPSVPKEGYCVNIIQHPSGTWKRVAARNNFLKSAGASAYEYFGDTLGGSSGSPLFNDAWEVIGIHRAGGPSSGVFVNGKEAAQYNLGVPIAAILGDLQAKAPAVYAEIAPAVLP